MRRRHTHYYLDTSALAKIYITEPGSRRLASWVGKRALGIHPSIQVCVSRIGFPEAMSAITRRRNTGVITSTAATRLWNEVASDFLHLGSPYDILEPSELIVSRAALLVALYGLRAYDAVQLASALRLQMELTSHDSLLFVSSDLRLNRAAMSERLSVADPTT
jgi:predicted nucleic acid-binding protein